MQCKSRFDLVVPHLIIYLIITAASLVPRPSYAQRIEGRVIDAETKAPLAFANIVLVGSSKGAMSLEDGRFALRRVPAGTYTVKVLMMGYKAVQQRNVVVQPDAVVNLVFELHTTIVAVTQPIDVFAERVDA
ncbi:MAG: carboxypeptidase-like regulatory domain-containing protein, partial [bacterium]|nr:carboxypeptidase-like regulatory domain-containing protein [bacterium]